MMMGGPKRAGARGAGFQPSGPLVQFTKLRCARSRAYERANDVVNEGMGVTEKRAEAHRRGAKKKEKKKEKKKKKKKKEKKKKKWSQRSSDETTKRAIIELKVGVEAALQPGDSPLSNTGTAVTCSKRKKGMDKRGQEEKPRVHGSWKQRRRCGY
ncbi:unnamed protein product [Pleuronectes platessa]|uniref:Uncharacterized protein n=1 Tax=Pleuronectes platessa TaxID=8262 RepID=A0A9N7VR99_PLEPL|nr:unnamed protein product [Pleuronectes platessa]